MFGLKLFSPCFNGRSFEFVRKTQFKATLLSESEVNEASNRMLRESAMEQSSDKHYFLTGDETW